MYKALYGDAMFVSHMAAGNQQKLLLFSVSTYA